MVVQNPIQVRRRGRPSEASTRRDLSQWELALNQISQREQREQRVGIEEGEPSQSANQPARRRGGRERRQRGGRQRGGRQQGGSQQGGSQQGGSQRACQPPPPPAPSSALSDVPTDMTVWNVID